jgi:hypothetical protein
MPEQKPEKKEASTAKQVLKCIDRVLFVLLLAVAVYFRVPWKVIVLFFGLALALVPKRARKWICWSAASVVLAMIIWVFLPDDNEAWRPFTFDDELAALEAKYAVSDEEDAAKIYNRLLADFDSESFFPDFWDWPVHHHVMSQAWSSAEHPQLAQWLQEHQGTIEKLLAATKKPKYRCSIGADPLTQGPMNLRLSAMRDWADLLVYSANNDLGEGQTHPGLEKLAGVVQMAQHLCQQPIAIDLLVGISVEETAVKSLNRFVVTGEAEEERLNFIEQTLGQLQHEWSEDFPRILEGEKLWAKNVFGILAYEVNRDGKVRMNRDPVAVARLHDPDYDFSPTDTQIRLAKVTALANWFLLPSSPNRAGKIIDDSYKDLYAMARADFEWPKVAEGIPLGTCIHLRWEYLIRLWTGPEEDIYHLYHAAYQRIIAQNRAGRLLLGLRRYKNEHGRWPLSLDDIEDTAAENFVDPINDDSFVYKFSGDSFKLYSKGKNKIDEDGKFADDGDDWPIWPPRNR